MKRLVTYALVSTICFFSCNDELPNNIVTPDLNPEPEFELVSIDSKSNSFSPVNSNEIAFRSSEQGEYSLRFKSMASLNDLIEKKEDDANSVLSLVKNRYPDFVSKLEIFNEAMEWADKYLDETEESYNKWKELYGEYLYFPEYKEDYGAYIPISDLSMAALANADGKIVIGDQIVDVKDVFSYEDLLSNGKDAYYTQEEVASMRSAAAGRIYNTSERFIGDEIDSGWFYDSDRDRKLRFKFGRQSNKKNINPIMNDPFSPGMQFAMNFKLEISFRKKTWLGWSNYSSETKTDMEITVGGIKYTEKFYPKAGSSSHDWTSERRIAWKATGERQNGRPIYFTPAVAAVFNTQFRAFDGVPVIKWQCNLPGVNFMEW